MTGADERPWRIEARLLSEIETADADAPVMKCALNANDAAAL